MLLYYLFWMFMGFIRHFYIIFGANLLTQSPVLVSVFFLVLEYRRKGKSDGVQLTWNFTELIFEPEEAHRVSEMDQESPSLPTKVGARPLPRGQPRGPPTYFFLPYIPIYPKNFEEHNRSGVPPPEASVATENQSRPILAPCRRGNPSPVSILIIPGLSMTRRE